MVKELLFQSVPKTMKKKLEDARECGSSSNTSMSPLPCRRPAGAVCHRAQALCARGCCLLLIMFPFTDFFDWLRRTPARASGPNPGDYPRAYSIHREKSSPQEICRRRASDTRLLLSIQLDRIAISSLSTSPRTTRDGSDCSARSRACSDSS